MACARSWTVWHGLLEWEHGEQLTLLLKQLSGWALNLKPAHWTASRSQFAWLSVGGVCCSKWYTCLLKQLLHFTCTTFWLRPFLQKAKRKGPQTIIFGRWCVSWVNFDPCVVVVVEQQLSTTSTTVTTSSVTTYTSPTHPATTTTTSTSTSVDMQPSTPGC